jgi:hypothetical protein
MLVSAVQMGGEIPVEAVVNCEAIITTILSLTGTVRQCFDNDFTPVGLSFCPELLLKQLSQARLCGGAKTGNRVIGVRVSSSLPNTTLDKPESEGMFLAGGGGPLWRKRVAMLSCGRTPTSDVKATEKSATCLCAR